VTSVPHGRVRDAPQQGRSKAGHAAPPDDEEIRVPLSGDVVERGGDLTDARAAAHFRLGAQPDVACQRRALLGDPAGGRLKLPCLVGRRRQRRARGAIAGAAASAVCHTLTTSAVSARSAAAAKATASLASAEPS
jgi:hypothetical protein